MSITLLIGPRFRTWANWSMKSLNVNSLFLIGHTQRRPASDHSVADQWLSGHATLVRRHYIIQLRFDRPQFLFDVKDTNAAAMWHHRSHEFTSNAGVSGKEPVMKSFQNLVVRLAREEQGGEVLEYALIAGLIVVAAIAAISSVGTKVLARWTSLNSSM